MTIERIFSGGRYERDAAYCRAVVAAGFVHVAGTTAQGEDIPTDAAGQCALALQAVGEALAAADTSFADVVRVTYVLPDRRDFESCWPVLRETFGANPPAATMIQADLIDPRYLIEIEVTALVPDQAAASG